MGLPLASFGVLWRPSKLLVMFSPASPKVFEEFCSRDRPAPRLPRPLRQPRAPTSLSRFRCSRFRYSGGLFLGAVRGSPADRQREGDPVRVWPAGLHPLPRESGPRLGSLGVTSPWPTGLCPVGAWPAGLPRTRHLRRRTNRGYQS